MLMRLSTSFLCPKVMSWVWTWRGRGEVRGMEKQSSLRAGRGGGDAVESVILERKDRIVQTARDQEGARS
jgi:hypothetical protein